MLQEPNRNVTQIPPLSRRKKISLASPPSANASYYANVFCYKRLFAPLLIPPCLALVLPPIASLTFSLLNIASRGHGILCLTSTLALTRLAYIKIRNYAPSAEDLAKALELIRYRLFLAILFIMCCFIRMTTLWLGLESHSRFVTSASTVSFGTRYAVGIAILSITVALRFVSNLGIVQCSTFPLPPNPIDATVSSLVSLDKWEQRLFAPKDTPQTRPPPTRIPTMPVPYSMTSMSLSSSQMISPKRYKRPATIKIILQIVVHLVAGMIFFHVTLLPSLAQYTIHPLAAQLCMLSCILMLTLTFTLTYLGEGNYHELTISKSNSGFSKTRILPALISVVKSDIEVLLERSKLILYWAVSPLLCLSGLTFFAGMLSVKDGFLGLLISYFATALIGLIVLISDIVGRRMLLVQGIDPDRLLFESFEYANDYSVECLMVDSILGGLGDDIIEDVNSDRMVFDGEGNLVRIPPSNHIFRQKLDVEEEELVRNNEMMEKVCYVVLSGAVCGSLRIEEESLKIVLLELLGGIGLKEDEMKKSRLPFDVTSRHYHALKRRLGSIRNNKSGSDTREIIPILRACCAYVGGIGEALTKSSDASPLTLMDFSLPPMCVLCCECALRGASRLILMCLADWDSSTNVQKQYNRISIFVPVLLHSIYRFRCGLLDHGRFLLEADGGWNKNSEPSQTLDFSKTYTRTKRTHNGPAEQAATLSFIATKFPNLSSALAACDSTAKEIMKAIRIIDGPGYAEVKVEADCKDWLKTLL